MVNELPPNETLLIVSVTLGLLAILAGILVGTVYRLRARGLLTQGLAQVLFLPGRRKKVFWLITLLGVLFVASGIVESFDSVGWLTSLEVDLLTSIIYGSGGLCMMLLVLVGLRPTSLTEAQRVELARISQDFLLLAFAPVDAREPPDPPK